MSEDWYWFGVLVDAGDHVKLRQMHVFAAAGEWRGEMWSKGDSGGLWHVREIAHGARGLVMQAVRAEIARWCSAYFLVDEGVPPVGRKQAKASPTGAAPTDFWADILGVDEADDKATVKAAFRARVMETHPDRGGDAEEFKRVYAAWEFIRDERGWR